MVTSSHGLLWQVFSTLILLVLLRCSVRAMLLAKVVLDKKVTMTLYFSSADSKTNAKIDGKKPAEVNAVIDSTAKTMTVTLDAGSHTITKQDTCNLFGIKLVPVKE